MTELISSFNGIDYTIQHELAFNKSMAAEQKLILYPAPIVKFLTRRDVYSVANILEQFTASEKMIWENLSKFPPPVHFFEGQVYFEREPIAALLLSGEVHCGI